MKATRENTKILVNDAGLLEISGDYINVVISPVEYIGFTVDPYLNADENTKYTVYSVYIHLCSNTIPIDTDEDLLKDLKDATKQILKI